jgi:hypothetical protein
MACYFTSHTTAEYQYNKYAASFSGLRASVGEKIRWFPLLFSRCSILLHLHLNTYPSNPGLQAKSNDADSCHEAAQIMQKTMLSENMRWFPPVFLGVLFYFTYNCFRTPTPPTLIFKRKPTLRTVATKRHKSCKNKAIFH